MQMIEYSIKSLIRQSGLFLALLFMLLNSYSAQAQKPKVGLVLNLQASLNLIQRLQTVNQGLL